MYVALWLLMIAACISVALADPATTPANPSAEKLVIVKALYGDLPNGPKADVTQKVAAMVENDKLSVEASNENFGDTAPNVPKKLQVQYTVGGVAGEKTVDEGQTLEISGRPARLVIRKAVFGVLLDGPRIDVTDKILVEIVDDTLTVEATTANFGDPAPGQHKKLRVDYTFDGKPHSKTVDENQPMLIEEPAPALRTEKSR
jgi:hypothetical protein